MQPWKKLRKTEVVNDEKNDSCAVVIFYSNSFLQRQGRGAEGTGTRNMKGRDVRHFKET